MPQEGKIFKEYFLFESILRFGLWFFLTSHEDGIISEVGCQELHIKLSYLVSNK